MNKIQRISPGIVFLLFCVILNKTTLSQRNKWLQLQNFVSWCESINKIRRPLIWCPTLFSYWFYTFVVHRASPEAEEEEQEEEQEEAQEEAQEEEEDSGCWIQ